MSFISFINPFSLLLSVTSWSFATNEFVLCSLSLQDLELMDSEIRSPYDFNDEEDIITEDENDYSFINKRDYVPKPSGE